MRIFRRLVGAFDWVHRISFVWPLVLGGAGLVGAAITWGQPLLPYLLGLAGFVSISLGVAGWFRARSAAPPMQIEALPASSPMPLSASKPASSKPRLIAKTSQLITWRAERDALVDQGDDLANELRLMDVESASDEQTEDIYERGKQFLEAVSDHRAKWWSGISIIEHAGLLAQVMSVADTPVPGPAWRAQLVSRIEYETNWLRNRGPKE